MKKHGLYVILDTRANDILGSQHAIAIHKHEATAVRMFADAASHPNSLIKQHPEDFDLVRIGTLDDETWELTPEKTIVLTGSSWAAALQHDRAESLTTT